MKAFDERLAEAMLIMARIQEQQIRNTEIMNEDIAIMRRTNAALREMCRLYQDQDQPAPAKVMQPVKEEPNSIKLEDAVKLEDGVKLEVLI